MKKMTALAILMALAVMMGGVAFAKSEIASVASRPRNDGGEVRNDGEKSQYSGGREAGWAMGESASVRLDNINR